MIGFVFEPGRADQPSPLTTQREYWLLKCPACGEAHERTVTQYWVDAQTSDEVSKMVTKHCFICAEHGIHYQIDPNFPFGIVKEIQYRPSYNKSREGDDDVIPF